MYQALYLVGFSLRLSKVSIAPQSRIFVLLEYWQRTLSYGVAVASVNDRGRPLISGEYILTTTDLTSVS